MLRHGISKRTPVPYQLANNVQDLSLPKSMIQRIAKGNLPANTQIHKDALLALHKSATVFVSYLAAKYVFSIELPVAIEYLP